MGWIRTHGDRLLIGSAAGCITLALAVLAYAAFASTPGAAFIVTVFTGFLFFTSWVAWYTTRRITRSRRHVRRLDHDVR